MPTLKYSVASFIPCSLTTRKEKKKVTCGHQLLGAPGQTTCQKGFAAVFPNLCRLTTDKIHTSGEDVGITEYLMAL